MYYFFGLDCLICSCLFLTVITFWQIDWIILTVNKAKDLVNFQWFDIRSLIRIIVFKSRHHLTTTTTTKTWAMPTRQCQQHCWISLPSSLPKPSFGPRFIASSDNVSSSPQTNDDSGVGRWVSLQCHHCSSLYGHSIHVRMVRPSHPPQCIIFM